jgi:hypothetical protein
MKELTISEKRQNSKYRTRLFKILLDDEDYEWARSYKWHFVNDRPATKVNGKYTGIHRLIMGIKVGEDVIVDHIDGNPLNNQKSNLRVCNRFQNQQNRKTNKNNTLPKGIRLLPSGKYNVRVQTYNERKVVGTFDTLEEAVSERNRVAKQLHGEFFNPAYIKPVKEVNNDSNREG